MVAKEMSMGWKRGRNGKGVCTVKPGVVIGEGVGRPWDLAKVVCQVVQSPHPGLV